MYLSLTTTVSNSILNEIQKIQKPFLRYLPKPKINYNTLCNTLEEGALQNVDIKAKIISLQCSWVKKLFDENHHDWRIIPLCFINKCFGKNFHFHPNLSFNLGLADNFQEFYKQILINCSTYFVSNSEVPSYIQPNFFRCNKHLLIGNRPVYL